MRELDVRLTASSATVRRDLDRLETAHAKLVERSGAKLILVNVKREPEE